MRMIRTTIRYAFLPLVGHGWWRVLIARSVVLVLGVAIVELVIYVVSVTTNMLERMF